MGHPTSLVLPLAEAIDRAQRAFVNLDESIRNASRRLTDLELLRPQCAAVLGYDPTAPGAALSAAQARAARYTTVKKEAAGGEAQPAAVAAAAAPSAVSPRPAAKLEPSDGAKQQLPARPSRSLRGAGGSADGVPPPPGAAASTAASQPAPAAAAAAARTGGQAAAAQVEAVGRSGAGAFKLTTTVSGKLKLTPWQALRRRAAAATGSSGASAVAGPGLPTADTHQAQQQQQEQQEPRAGGSKRGHEASAGAAAAGEAGEEGEVSSGEEEDLPLVKRQRRLLEQRRHGKQQQRQRQQLPGEALPAPMEVDEQQGQQEQGQQHQGQQQQSSLSDEAIELPSSSDLSSSGVGGFSADEDSGAEQQQPQQQQQSAPPDLLSGASGKPQLVPSAAAAGPGRPPQQQLGGGCSRFGVGAAGGGSAGAITKWYAVAVGRRPGLYTTWTDCAAQVLGYRGGEYHSFSSEAAARQYLQRRGVDVDAALAAQAEAQQRVAQEEAQEQQRQALAEAEAQQQLGAAAADTQQQQLAAAAPVGPAAAGSDGTSSGSPPPEGNSASSGSDASGSSGDGIDGSAGGQPASGGPLLSDPQAAKQMRQHFNSPDLQGRGRKSGMAGAKQRSRRARAAGRPPKPPKGPSPSLDKAQTAWEQAAMAWRQKNMPSKAEIKKIVKEQAAAALPRYRPPSRTPMDHVQSERGGPATARPQGGKAGGEAGGGGKGMSRKQRAHYRHMCQARVQGIASFAQVLRIFGVPCDPSRLREAYRQAVRMYHPDSNSKEKVWSTEEEKVEAEEVMKTINERKPSDL